MKYKLVTSRTQLENILKDVEKRASESTDKFRKSAGEDFFITNVHLAKEICNSLRPYDKLEDSADPRLKVKTDKAQLKLAWRAEAWCDKREGSNYSTARVTGLFCKPVTLVLYKGVLLRPSFYPSKTAAEFSLFDDDTNYTILQGMCVKGLIEPQRMGTITEKGVEAWYQYLTKKQKIAADMQGEKDTAWNEFLAGVRGLAHEFGLDGDGARGEHGNRFYYSPSDLAGFLVINGLELKFGYNKNEGYINRELRLATYGGDSALEKFSRLCHNRWSE